MLIFSDFSLHVTFV